MDYNTDKVSNFKEHIIADSGMIEVIEERDGN